MSLDRERFWRKISPRWLKTRDVDGAVFEALAMDLGAGQLADHFVAVVDNVENLLGHKFASKWGRGFLILRAVFFTFSQMKQRMCFWRWLFCLAAAGFAATTSAGTQPIQLRVDATDAGRRLLHAYLEIPVKPGKLTLVYPKWGPGEHMPNSLITIWSG